MTRHTKDDETSAHGSRHGSAANSLEREEHAWSDEDTADSREQAHRDVGNARLKVILADLLEVEVAIEASHPSDEGDQHLGERRVNVHEEFALDVLGSEAAEAVKRVSRSEVDGA